MRTALVGVVLGTLSPPQGLSGARAGGVLSSALSRRPDGSASLNARIRSNTPPRGKQYAEQRHHRRSRKLPCAIIVARPFVEKTARSLGIRPYTLLSSLPFLLILRQPTSQDILTR